MFFFAVEDFNTTITQTGVIPDLITINLIDDSGAELTEGFLILLELERALIDQRDYARIQFLNDVILVTINDNG